MSIFDTPVTLLDGRSTTLQDWAGHLILVVNTASECGLTGQYEGLQRLFDDYAMRGFFVIGMPCNQFGAQEPGTAEDIATFCSRNYGVSFPMLAKADVNGEDTHPLFAELKKTPDASGEAGDVQWNFEKFLIAPSGEVIGRFRPKTDPEDDEIVDLIEENLPI
ncbi:Hydroperoxy fatty acid reductase gpx1 [Corynebacterium kalinowskii]|uniref:Glutathione peroxidase n=1 Tax=Corynebacterium kalinowskii TaxID=2675216 RepID=A0A6B8V873_9CORY|nr:glutathione peroxidase [Corynebacterium kalinowskii]QGU01312.1 Hydroperoxy fatty acid reductase gpx1 [Corynebacterium kalinowskii]